MNCFHSRNAWRPMIAALALCITTTAAACTAAPTAQPLGEIATAAAPSTPLAAATIPASLPAGEPTVLILEAVPTLTLDATALPTLAPASAPTSAPTPAPAPAESLLLLPTATPPQQPQQQPAPSPTPLFEPTPDGTQRTAKVPILMYHYISTPPAGADVYRIDLSTPPDLFAAHLDRLKAEGYTAITLYQLLAHLTQGAPLPEKPVVLTFDDGYRDNYENAFPLLRQRGMPATFFVVTDFIDEQRPLYLSWDMAREMLAGGMSIESHSRNHFTLEGQDDDYLVWQALGSLETLAFELGVRPRFVSYPAGDYDERTIAIFHSANYWGGLTTTQGATQSSDRPFEMERIRIRNTTTPDDLIRLLQADW